MRVFFAESDVLDFALMHKWMADMPEDKRQRTKRLRRQQDQALAICAHRLFCFALKKTYGITAKPSDWGFGENGKPYLKNRAGVFFNISHSGNIAMCALHNAPVGVDIELIGKDKDEVAKRIMSKEEHNAYLAARDKNGLFYKIWTLKEAYIKYSGKGLSCALDATTIYPHGKQIRTNVFDCRFTLLNSVRGYQAAVCSNVSADNMTERINCEELIDF